MSQTRWIDAVIAGDVEDVRRGLRLARLIAPRFEGEISVSFTPRQWKRLLSAFGISTAVPAKAAHRRRFGR